MSTFCVYRQAHLPDAREPRSVAACSAIALFFKNRSYFTSDSTLRLVVEAYIRSHVTDVTVSCLSVRVPV